MLGRCGNQPAILAGLVRQTGHLQNKLATKTSHIGVLWASLVILSHLGGSSDGFQSVYVQVTQIFLPETLKHTKNDAGDLAVGKKKNL